MHRVHFWDTYARAASWPIICLVIILCVVLEWSSVQIDYVQAYAQADVEKDNVYMNGPKGFDLTNGENARDWVFTLGPFKPSRANKQTTG